ncbi:MAG: dihydrofolate reductase [Rhodospirillales bacterium]|nr:dihydrofolate reductase [Alphaproteobacteria bacterium]USO04553.1 MAG: dihydrofolate reductase [Rhodospirillales bacterium]
MLSLIVAAAENNVIGKDNQMPWHISEDFKHFKEVTMGKPCIMGRKTYESILAQLGKALPGRTSIVVSRSGFKHEGALTCASLEEAVSKAEDISEGEIMVVGGAQIYEQALPLAQRIYLTRVHQSPEGDAFFPALGTEWTETAREDHKGFSFVTLEKT